MMHGRSSEERRRSPVSDEQLEAIARRAAEIALEKVYSEVGKGVVKRFAWAIGIIAIGVISWLIKKGHIPI